MTKIGINTKRAEGFAQDWIRAQHKDKTGLYDYYCNPSATKEQAFEDLRNKWLDLWQNAGYKAVDLHYEWRPIVTSASCHQFTVMYIAPQPETRKRCLFVETRCNTYYIDLETVVPDMKQYELHRMRNELGL